MSEETKPVIKLNIDKFTDKVSKVIEDKFVELEKNMTPAKETTALTEAVKTTTVLENFDWKLGVEEMLRNKRKSVGVWADHWDEPLKVKEITTAKYNEETRETEYSLKMTESLMEAIGTIGGGTIGATCCIPEIWADKIARDHVYPGSVFLGAWFVDWYTDIERKPGDKVYICRVGPALCADMACVEPTTDAPTITCPYITLEHDVCAYAICKNDIDTVQYGLVDALNAGLGSCLEVCVDNYFFGVALACVNRGTLLNAGPMTGSLILEAMGTMLAGNQTKLETKDLNSCTHIINTIRFLICALWEHPKKHFAPIVDILEKVVRLRVKHIAQNVISILSLIRNGRENIGETGQKITQSAIRPTIKETMLDSSHYMKNSEKWLMTSVIYVAGMINDLNSMRKMENHTQLIPSTLEITLKTLYCYANHVTKQHIGQCSDSIGNTTNLRNSYLGFSDQILYTGQAHHAPSSVDLADAGHQLHICKQVRRQRCNLRWTT